MLALSNGTTLFWPMDGLCGLATSSGATLLSLRLGVLLLLGDITFLLDCEEFPGAGSMPILRDLKKGSRFDGFAVLFCEGGLSNKSAKSLS